MINMIINISRYRCPNCKKFYKFETSKSYSTDCQNCYVPLKLIANYDMDTEKTEEVPEMKAEQYLAYINRKPTVTCPYCQSTNTKKISGASRWMSTGIFGLASGKIGKQWRCTDCKSDF